MLKAFRRMSASNPRARTESRYRRLPLSLVALEARENPSYAFTGGVADATLDLTDAAGNLASGATVVLAPSQSNPTGSIALGANRFNFYGTEYDTVNVSYNGLITFTGPNNLAGNANLGTTLSLTQPAIAPLWDSWFSTTSFSSKGVVAKLDGAANKLIVQWDRMEDSNPGEDVTFQAILSLNSGITPGAIRFNYLDVDTGSASTANGQSATVGVKEKSTASQPAALFTQVSHNALNANVQSGKDITLSWNNTAPQNLLLGLSAPQINENGSVLLSGSFTDPNVIDTHTVTIDWGDGSPNTTLNPAKGTYAFSGVSHQYMDNPSGKTSYTITATVKDSQGESSLVTASIQVMNVTPTISIGGDATINEGGTFSRAGSFADPGTLDATWVAEVDYGDGSAKQPLALAGANFNLSHLYADQGTYTVTVYVKDKDNATGQATLAVTVNNVLPSLVLNGALGSPTVAEGASLVLPTIATYGDAGTNADEIQSWTINWGDGSSDSKSLPGHPGTIGGSHTYADNGTYTVTVSILDDVGPAVSKSFLVTVTNVAPVVTLDPSLATPRLATEGQSLTINNIATFVDPGFANVNNPINQPGGTNETFTFAVNWGDGTSSTVGSPTITQEGSPGVATAGQFGASHVYADDGVYTASVTVSDDDGAVSIVRTFQVVVGNEAPVVTSPVVNRSIGEGTVLSIPTLVTFTDRGFSNPSNPLSPPNGSQETFTYTINWGDGTSVDTGSVTNVTHGSAGKLTTGAIENITHTFADDGSYTVVVTIFDDNGGSTQQSFTVAVSNLNPTVTPITNQIVNEGNLLSLATAATVSDPGFDNSTLGTSETFSYTINWGDGTSLDSGTVTSRVSGSAGTATTGAVENVSHTFADNGVYTVTVVVTDDNGGIASNTFTVTVNNVSPTISSISPNRTASEGGLLSISNLISFSDPGFHNPANPNQTGGSFESFSYSINWGDGTTNDGGPVTAFTSGAAGVATTGQVQNVSHTYADNGVYTVTVTVTDDDGAADSKTFLVLVDNAAPVVSVVGGQTIAEGATLSIPNVATFTDAGFDNPNRPGGASTERFTFSINWGDGTTADTGSITNFTTGSIGTPSSGSLNASHTFADDGVYTVTLRINDDDGGTTTQSFTVTVTNVAPTVAVAANQTIAEGSKLSISGIGSFSDPGFDNANKGTVESFTYSVNWGDGTAPTTGSVTNVIAGTVGTPTTGSFDSAHTYADDGMYTVTVTITDDNGGATAKNFQVVVTNVAPSVAVAGNQSVIEGGLLTVPNLATFSDPGFDNASKGTVENFTYSVNWGDGTTVETGSVPTGNVTVGGVGVPTTGFLNGSHTYADNGLYTVSVTITDDNGGATTKSFQVVVGNAAPNLTVVGNQTKVEGSLLSLANIATWTDPGFDNPANPNAQPNGSRESFTLAINWGDGTTADAGIVPLANITQGSPGTPTAGFLNAAHTFAENGVYTVSVTLTDDDGAAVSKSFTVTVDNAAPVLSKVAADQVAVEGGLVAISTIGSFVDPGFDNPLNPNQTGGTVERYTYTINWGDGATETKSVVNFQNGGVGTASTGSFGGSHTYADNGSYTVSATVLDDDTGLSNVISFTVTVSNADPVLNVAAAQSVVEGSPLNLAPIATFSDTGFSNLAGVPSTAETFSYIVNWGDGSANSSGSATVSQNGFPGSPTVGSVAASHVYADDGVYTVTVTLTDDDGGSTTKSLTVTVLNAAPTLSVVGPQTFAEGQTFILPTLGTLQDAGFANDLNPNGASEESFTYTVNWGDGTTPETGTVTLTQIGSPGVPTLGTFGQGHTYDRVGTFNVTVRVTDDNGGFDEKTLPITVTNVAPTLALATGNLVATEGATVSIATVGTFTDPGFSLSETYSYTIAWGDGAVSKGAATVDALGSIGVPTTGSFGSSHAYADNGLYTVSVTIADSNGGTSTGTFSIQVTNVAPTLTLAVPAVVTVSEGAQLSLPTLANFSDPGFGLGETFTYSVNWGDGTSSGGKASVFQVGGPDSPSLGKFGEAHTYAKNGDYGVTVSLTDKDGGTSTATFTVKAVNVAPTNLIYSIDPTPLAEGSVLALTGSFTDPGQFDPHTVAINWGDGSAPVSFDLLPGVTFFNLRNVGGNFLTHTYAQNSTGAGYPVTVTVTDDAGLFTVEPTVAVVQNVAPSVTIATPQKVTKDVRFVVTSDVSDPGVLDKLTYAWTVRDPDGKAVFTASTQNLEYTSPITGTHSVSLTVTDGDGGSTTKTASIRVQNSEIFVIAADAGGGPRVAIFDAKTQTRVVDFFAYEETYRGGVRVAVGDTQGDGSADVITATGIGGGPRVRVIDSETQAVLADFFVYEETYRGGMFLAVGDVNDDGADDIATAPDVGGGPRVKVVDGKTQKTIFDDFVFDPELRNGTRVALNDVNGDGFADVVVSSGPGGNRVRAIDVKNGRTIFDQVVFDTTNTGGVFVAAGDVEGDGRAEIIVAAGPGSLPIVRAFDAVSGKQVTEFQAYEESYTGGVRVAAFDYDGDGRTDILTGTGFGGGPAHRIWKPFTNTILESFYSFEDTFIGGVYVGAGD
ncbi:MAG: PKD domain-containing protein [Gemmataceae bacterium]|nr:PKD domain-containing protein [Gemmataceae bacterium]